MNEMQKMIAIAKKFGGGGSPSEIVILPETELTVINASDDGGQYMLTTPFENKPTGGSTCKFMWGGVEYTSPVVDATAVAEAPLPVLVYGNSDMMGFTEALGSNPAPDAPFFGMMYPDGMEEDGIIQYLLFAASGDIVADPPVLSIVNIGGEESDDASGVLTVKCVSSTSFIDSKTTISGADKSFSEVAAAYKSGKLVRFIAQYRSDDTNCDFVGVVRYAAYENSEINTLVIEFPQNMFATARYSFGFNADGFTFLN